MWTGVHRRGWPSSWIGCLYAQWGPRVDAAEAPKAEAGHHLGEGQCAMLAIRTPTYTACKVDAHLVCDCLVWWI